MEMTTSEPMKVYELAKELGIDSISLLDRLRGLNIEVKSHMSELTHDQAEAARAALTQKTTKSKSDAKKAGAVVRKRAPTADKSPASSETAAVVTEKPAAKTKTTRKAAAQAPEPTPPATDPSGAASAGAPSPIIRRRSRGDGAPEPIASAIARPNTAPEVTSSGDPVFQQEDSLSTEESIEAAAAAQNIESVPMTEAPAPRTPSVEKAPASTVSVTTSSSGIRTISINRAEPLVRRNVLKIIENAPAPRATTRPATDPSNIKSKLKGTETKDKDGFRIVKITKENLDQMAEEEATKRKGGVKGDIRPEDVKFADYRKKEMVFLPKKKKIPVGKELKQTQITTPSANKRVVEVQNTISVQDLANQMSVKAGQVIAKLMGLGQMATINQSLDFDTVSLVAGEFGFEAKNVAFAEESVIKLETDIEESLQPRPPVVTIMGHVDHGKTTLLDSIRSANVAAQEAGGITQHIGAYTIQKDGKMITFIDTPGHEAFTAMRARGANVTDIVILVVSADDGVMPQTREAVAHAKAAGVPIIVAVNKIDKPGANPEKPKQALAELELLAEDWGGDTMFVPVSALKGTNIDKLLESILLVAEVQNYRANPNAFASGIVLESKLEKGKGPVATVLVKRGTLRVGNIVVAGPNSGRIKAMIDHTGSNVTEIRPGMAVEILGLDGVPNAGEKFDAVETDQDAAKVVTHREQQIQAQKAARPEKMSLDALFSKVQAGAAKELRVILKTDVFGSLEAVKESLNKTSNEKVKVNIIHTGTGGITESDVLLATASNAIIVGFNVRPETKARQVAEAEHVEIKSYSIIYELIDDVKKAMAGLLDKKKVETYLGRAEVRQTFSVPKIGVIAGSAVIDGKILRGANARLLRDSKIIYEGKMSSLKRFKDDAKEVAQGYECGIGLENYNDVKPGDIIEAYQIEMIAQELNG